MLPEVRLQCWASWQERDHRFVVLADGDTDARYVLVSHGYSLLTIHHSHQQPSLIDRNLVKPDEGNPDVTSSGHRFMRTDIQTVGKITRKFAFRNRKCKLRISIQNSTIRTLELTAVIWAITGDGVSNSAHYRCIHVGLTLFTACKNIIAVYYRH